MNAREIIFANLEHTCPERLGLTFDDGRINDMVWVGFGNPAGYTQRRWVEGNIEYYDDMWGNVWHRMVDGCAAGEVLEPAIREWDQLDDMVLPDFTGPDCSAEMKRAFAAEPDKFKLAGLANWIFASARYIRKMEVYFVDMAAHPEELHRLHELIAGVLASQIQAAGKAGADGICFAEDMGTQQGLLFSPQMWREFFEEKYTRLFGLAHELGLKVLMHSCGKNVEILPDLLKAGVDCFQFDQPALYDMTALAELLRDAKAALWSPVDIQKVMPTGDRNLIETKAREMVRTFQGGLICKNYGDLPGIGVRPEWDMWAYDAILDECGVTMSEPGT